jgi:membrane protease YdiL (CAAX protease family)
MDPAPVTLVGLAIAVFGFRLVDWCRRAVRPRGDAATAHPADERDTADIRDHAWKWAIPACLLVVVAVEGATLASIGWRGESPVTFLRRVVVGVGVLFGLNVLSIPFWTRVGDRGESLAAGLGGFAALSVPERLFVAATAGATEETAFHGYTVERLLALTGSLPLAGGVGFAAFTLGHLGATWDRHAVARIAQPALVTTLLYLHFRSLPVLIAIHAVNDAVALLSAERFAARAGGGDAGSGPADPVGTDGSAAVGWLREE